MRKYVYGTLAAICLLAGLAVKYQNDILYITKAHVRLWKDMSRVVDINDRDHPVLKRLELLMRLRFESWLFSEGLVTEDSKLFGDVKLRDDVRIVHSRMSYNKSMFLVVLIKDGDPRPYHFHTRIPWETPTQNLYEAHYCVKGY